MINGPRSAAGGRHALIGYRKQPRQAHMSWNTFRSIVSHDKGGIWFSNLPHRVGTAPSQALSPIGMVRRVLAIGLEADQGRFDLPETSRLELSSQSPRITG